MAHTLNKRSFSIVSVMVTLALSLLTIVQCVWVWKTYNDNVDSFQRRVQLATYRTIYKSFRNSDLPGTTYSRNVYIDLTDFATWFEPYLKELEVYQPYYLEVINHTLGDKVMMRSGNTDWLFTPWTFETQIDDRGMFSLRLTISVPRREMLGDMWLLILSSVVMVAVLAASFIYLRRTLFRYRSLEEMRRNLTHNITHELKTPISVAVTATDALRNFSADANPDRRSRYLEIVETQLTQLSTMVEHILSVSVEGREYKYNPTVVYLQEIISGLIQGAGMNTGKKPVFNIDCAEHIKIMADEFHIKNLLATVIDNAVKYSADPVVGIRVFNKDNEVTIEIEDNGCGISKEHLSHVFEKFYRVPTGDIHTVRGYGLGLYYAKQVAELHKGTISMNSRVGKGTTVTIKLPRNEQ